MNMPSRTWSLIGLGLALAACDQPRSSGERMAAETSETGRAEQDIARTEDGVRLSLAEKRIAELQKKIAEMEVTPESVEIELLKGRLEAVEAKAYARQDNPALPVVNATATPISSRAATPSSQTGAKAVTREGARTSSKLPQLETSPRPATDAEKAAFNTRSR